jgi:Na+/glutamate symporter
MENFWDSNVWGTYLLIGILLASLLVANVLKRKIPFLRNSLIPNSVLGGILILLLVWIYKLCSRGVSLFDAEIFGGNA